MYFPYDGAQPGEQSTDTNSRWAASLVTPKYASVINAMPCLHNRGGEAMFVLCSPVHGLEKCCSSLRNHWEDLVIFSWIKPDWMLQCVVPRLLSGLSHKLRKWGIGKASKSPSYKGKQSNFQTVHNLSLLFESETVNHNNNKQSQQNLVI